MTIRPYVATSLMTSALAVFVGVITMLAGSADGAIKTERIEYTHEGTRLVGVLAYDDAVTTPRPGVLVCHEWWGCNDYAAKRATMLAEQGYVAFALDMYGLDASGKPRLTIDPKQAGAWAGEVMKDQAVLRGRAAAGLAVLAEHARVDKAQLAAIGYCMGGTVALELARSGKPHTSALKAIVAFHASTIAAKSADDNANIKGSILICHGQRDDFVQPEQISSFHEQMNALGKDYQFISYAGAVHAFTNPDADLFKIDGVKYNAKADKRSWATMKALFAEVFGGK